MRKLMIALALAALPGLAVAQTDSTRRIDKRQSMQDKRIDKAAASGALNEKEQRRLEKGQQRVDKMETKATADGKVSAKERARIEKMQDRESARIRREANDKQIRK